MLFTAYSTGLRVSEIQALQIKQIYNCRMQIWVEPAKGKKQASLIKPGIASYIKRLYQNLQAQIWKIFGWKWAYR